MLLIATSFQAKQTRREKKRRLESICHLLAENAFKTAIEDAVGYFSKYCNLQ